MRKLIGKAVSAKLTPAEVAECECRGKKSFATRKQAETAAKRLARREKEKFGIYKCRICSGFHVGAGRPVAKKPRLDDVYDESGIVIGRAGRLEW